LNDLLPTFLPTGNHNFHRNAATVELTPEGVDSPITQILDDPEKNAQRWKSIADTYRDLGMWDLAAQTYRKTLPDTQGPLAEELSFHLAEALARLHHGAARLEHSPPPR
jgi:hypothetical protein